ncbi:MAG: hypothetical protein M3294_06010, partial [Pseudomonadota bacterium]|nr:hypothetical protein [Pseudomonadota bacterium]
MDLRPSLFIVCMLIPQLVRAITGVDVDIIGVEGELADNARAFLSIAAEDEEEKGKVSAREVRRLYLQAPSEIRQALQPFGYYSPRIQSSLKRTDGGWLARFRIAPGPPTIVRQTKIKVKGPGAEEPAVRAALASIEVKKGA